MPSRGERSPHRHGHGRGHPHHRRIKIRKEPWYRRLGRGLRRNRTIVLTVLLLTGAGLATWWFILPRYFETVSGRRDTATLAGVVSEYLQSLGGIETIRNIQSLRFTGTMQRGDDTFQFALFKRRPDLIRSLYYVEDYRVVTAYDGEQAWMQIDDTGRGISEARLWEGPEAASLIADSAFDSPLVRPQGDFSGLSLMPPTLLDGRPFHRVRYERPHPFRENETYPVIYYLDQETLEERLVVEQRDGKTFRTRNADFRVVAGARLPHRITRFAGAEQVWEVRLKQIRANIGVPSSFFAVPADARPAEE